VAVAAPPASRGPTALQEAPPRGRRRAARGPQPL